MSRLKLVAVSGNVSKPSRTRALVDAVSAAVAERLPVSVTTLDLAEIGPKVAGVTWRRNLPDDVEAIYRTIEGADLLVVGSPIYKASYTGLFKHLFDQIDPEALAGVPVALTATGGSDRHALALDHQFRPLFAFFGALVAPTTIFARDTEFTDHRLTTPETLARVTRLADEVAGLAARARPDVAPTHLVPA